MSDVEKIDTALREIWDKAKIPVATLDIECFMMNPPVPGAIGVMVAGHLIAIITLDEIERAHARLLELQLQAQAAAGHS